ncbi:unnamed protein product, partial [Rotaria sp. Silwood1]
PTEPAKTTTTTTATAGTAKPGDAAKPTEAAKTTTTTTTTATAGTAKPGDAAKPTEPAKTTTTTTAGTAKPGDAAKPTEPAKTTTTTTATAGTAKPGDAAKPIEPAKTTTTTTTTTTTAAGTAKSGDAAKPTELGKTTTTTTTVATGTGKPGESIQSKEPATPNQPQHPDGTEKEANLGESLLEQQLGGTQQVVQTQQPGNKMDSDIRGILEYYNIADTDVVVLNDGPVQRLVQVNPEWSLPPYVQQDAGFLQEIQNPTVSMYGIAQQQLDPSYMINQETMFGGVAGNATFLPSEISLGVMGNVTEGAVQGAGVTYWSNVPAALQGQVGDPGYVEGFTTVIDESQMMSGLPQYPPPPNPPSYF